VDALGAVLEPAQRALASRPLASTTLCVPAQTLDLHQLVRPVPLGSSTTAVQQTRMEHAKTALDTTPVVFTSREAVPAPPTERRWLALVALLDSTWLVVAISVPELASHALRRLQEITRAAAPEATLESLLYAPPALAGNSTPIAAAQAVARAQYAQPAQVNLISQAALELLILLALYAQVTEQLITIVLAASGRILALQFHVRTRSAVMAHTLQTALERFQGLARHAQATTTSITTPPDAVAAILDILQLVQIAALGSTYQDAMEHPVEVAQLALVMLRLVITTQVALAASAAVLRPAQ